ncbi:hypothetical protein LNAOJCKE_1592 [Methylorubrum aminovorans]|uniref:Uncharacterized protein n=1 Tax=Methylorubrum aminovorans TaxID=269069 RepID=A0ABQ4UD21_9HYPH|nr:hypothetical protein [Methylorubrum aminovorans]GJE64388.1 hypothetical protein LNAOJCKE_1592 [Methylorubrum aminovorans]GMA76183.1 hypothetical protein GCM10025880_26000 [Methylorubrum aminovorans]
MHIRLTDVLCAVSNVMREDQLEWLNSLTAYALEHDLRAETVRRMIDLACDYIESSTANDVP